MKLKRNIVILFFYPLIVLSQIDTNIFNALPAKSDTSQYNYIPYSDSLLLKNPLSDDTEFNFNKVQQTDSKDNPYSYMLPDTSQKELNIVYKPIIHLGHGFFTFLGDVKDNYYLHPAIGRTGWNLGISRTINNFFDIKFNVVLGKLSGNSFTPGKYFNFETNILAGSVLCQYNFKHLTDALKLKPLVLPQISIGFESFDFDSKADMRDANGYYYYLWSDGTLRNVPESQGNELNSIILHRDYVYETDLRELNLDGLGKYSQIAIAIPIDLGFEYKFTHRLKAKIGISYHLVLNDNIDNISSKGKGLRKGNKSGDSFLYSYFSVSYDLFSQPKLTFIEEHYKDFDISTIDKTDEDSDGIIDLWDECPETPLGVKVDKKGCPLDTDEDGIPDYIDKEINSPKGAMVNLEGIAYKEEELISLTEKISNFKSVNNEDVCLYYPEVCEEQVKKRKVKHFKTFYDEIPQKFKPFDLNNDNIISIEEINIAIDKFFEMSTHLTEDDVYELINLFFNQ
ncbi:MAG: hypothetical protein N3A01_03505 [Bacteroidales bacterium]|nr:hypothetical protein [Bacteroidales bacterium]